MAFCQTHTATVDLGKLSSDILPPQKLRELLQAVISFLPSLPHDVKAALNGAGVAGVADLLWAASLAEPLSMRALLSECVIPVF